jgi:hypothetical protein
MRVPGAADVRTTKPPDASRSASRSGSHWKRDPVTAWKTAMPASCPRKNGCSCARRTVRTAGVTRASSVAGGAPPTTSGAARRRCGVRDGANDGSSTRSRTPGSGSRANASAVA